MNNDIKYPLYYIGHTNESNDRKRASSGGIGTCVTKYLLQSGQFGTSMTFIFDREQCMYVPQLIYKAGNVNVCGSIYQDIDIVRFIREHVSDIKDGIVLSCPPCQVAPIRQLLKRKGIKNFILSFCCSGQTKIEGTWCYYRFLGIDKKVIVSMQYRGNGWPSGIQIRLKNGDKVYHDNYTEPWTTIHKSWLFRPKRCFYCKLDTGHNADISLADPWLEDYLKNDHIGNTLFLINTQAGRRLFDDLQANNFISAIESDYNSYAIAQKPNIQKGFISDLQKKYLKNAIYLMDNKCYFRWATKSEKNMRRHLIILRIVKLFSEKKNMINFAVKRLNNLKQRVRSHFIAKKLGGCKGNFNISEGVIINNPKCIFVGKHVGIGAFTFFGPVTEYADIAYNTKIIIGDNTWIGKHCSIASISKVQIGKNVLFAGYVHITDHSHGYEDISRPISPQPLICKGPVVIEDDCWLGYGCEILSGVHIGKHCIVAARAVVTKNVPDYSIVAGNPAKVIKQYNFETKRWERTSH